MPNLRLGLAYANLGTTIAGYSQAAALRLGGSYLLDISSTNQLLLAVSGARGSRRRTKPPRLSSACSKIVAAASRRSCARVRS